MGVNITPLHGGTLGDVKLIEGKFVKKTQKKWERHGDPLSWRREYDLYKSELGSVFTDALRWPECFFAEDRGEEIELWLEYIDGVSGTDLTVAMMEEAALELGWLQGRLYVEKPAFLQNLNLSKTEYMKNFYHHYRSWDVVHNAVRSDESELPKHLCQMLINIDENEAEVFNRVEQLPIVLCHRDFWVTNIFHTENGIRLIDWDTAGWGYLGEDMASLITDEADVEHMAEVTLRCVPAYHKGFSETSGLPPVKDHCVTELILLMFGYRLVEWVLHAKTPEEKKLHLDTLQKIYEIKEAGL